MNTLFKAALAAGAGMTLTGAANAAQWEMPVRSNLENFMTENIATFAEDVESATNGDMTITLHPEDSLVAQPDVLRAVQTGQVQAGEYLMSMQSNLDPIFAVDSIPFLATSYDANHRLADAARSEIEASLGKRGLKLLFIQSWPFQSIYSDRKIEQVSDFDGMAMRAYNPNTARIAELLGATPVTIQQSEVPQAFSTGVIDGMITSPTTGIDTQAWDFVDYFYNVRAFITWNVVVVNQAAFDALPDDEKQAVEEAATTAEERAWKTAPEVTDEQIDTLADNGMTVAEPSEQLAASLREIGDTMLQEWLDKAGDRGKAIIDAYREGQ